MSREKILQAFESCRDGFSADRVVADPELNSSFLRCCRDLELSLPDEELNKCLLNARKAGTLRSSRTEKRTFFADAEEYAFASEIAIRSMERQRGVTLDQVICSPELASEFDELAARIAPGYSPLQYRWAALSLRKRRGLVPEPLARVLRPIRVENSPVASLDLNSVPSEQGAYMFFDRSKVLYVGEACSLRQRIAKHLEHSDNKGLARWLWDHGDSDLGVEYQVLPPDATTSARKAFELELIRSRSPVFNVQGKSA